MSSSKKAGSDHSRDSKATSASDSGSQRGSAAKDSARQRETAAEGGLASHAHDGEGDGKNARGDKHMADKDHLPKAGNGSDSTKHESGRGSEGGHSNKGSSAKSKTTTDAETDQQATAKGRSGGR